MKTLAISNILFVFWGVLLVIGGFFCGYSRQPKLYLENVSYNFGTIRSKRVIAHRFKIKNIGRAPLFIERVITSCKCAIASMPARSLRPGEEAYLSVRIDESVKSGKVLESVILECNDADKIHKLSLEGSIDPGCVVNPQLLDCGLIQSSDLPFQQIINVQSSDGKSFDKCPIILTDSEFVRGKLRVLDSKRGVYEINIEIPKTAPAGPIASSIYIKYEIDSEEITIPVRISGNVLGRFRAEPDILYFGSVPEGVERRMVGYICEKDSQKKERIGSIEIYPKCATSFICSRIVGLSAFQIIISSNAPPGDVMAVAKVFQPGDKCALQVPIYANIKAYNRADYE